MKRRKEIKRGGRPRKLIAIDVFSGCGGTTQGLRDAGFRVLGGVEFDSLAVKTYRVNHPSTKVWATDIRRLDPQEILDRFSLKPGDLDLLVGCPPCQAFSSLKRLNGGRTVRDKDAKDLIFEMLRFAQRLLPKVVLVENVPGLLHDHRFAELKRRLSELGYRGEPSIRDAADYGVPQRRRRMVYIATRIGDFKEAQAVHSPASVRDAIASLPRPSKSKDPLHALTELRSEKVAALIKRIPKNGGSRRDAGDEFRLKCHERSDGFKDVYGRMAWDAVAPTITGGCVNPSKGRFLHPEQNRAITLREAALLQSFPRDYWFSLDRGKFAAALMIGNAFPPNFVKAHAEQIRNHLKQVSRQPDG